MKKSIGSKNIDAIIILIFSSIALLSACKSPAENQPDNENSSAQAGAPVGIILPASSDAPPMEIGILSVPRADDKAVAENMSVAFHQARAKCAGKLTPDTKKTYTLTGVTVFQGKISVSKTRIENDPVSRCIGEALNNQSLPGFKNQTYVLEIQFAIRDHSRDPSK